MNANKLSQWVSTLRCKNMPVLGTVIAELNAITESDESSASQLAEVILRDPNLTSHVLRVANSVQYNYGKQQISTISRAIVLIGLKGVRAICISLLILDRMLTGQSKEHVLRLVAQGFHAAVQAQSLLCAKAARLEVGDDEEVFIAALLFNLGEMAFWLSEELNGENSVLLHDDPSVRNRAQTQLLGGTFKSLTLELARHWSLGDTLIQALSGNAKTDRVQAVITGERLSRAAMYGWESEQFKKVLTEVATYLSISVEQALKDVKKAADKASEVAVGYGAANVCPMIPSSVGAGYFTMQSASSKVMQPDAKLQLSVLRELTNAAADGLDVNAIFQTLLEGLHRGVGLERVAIAFIKGTKLEAKYVLGEGTNNWREKFYFDADPYSDNIFTHAIELGDAVWLDASFADKNEDLYTSNIRTLVGRVPCLIYTIKINNKPRAIIYADRAFFGGVLDQEQFEAFKHFCSQAKMCLNAASAHDPAGRR